MQVIGWPGLFSIALFNYALDIFRRIRIFDDDFLNIPGHKCPVKNAHRFGCREHFDFYSTPVCSGYFV
jgi:hypothetical protein